MDELRAVKIQQLLSGEYHASSLSDDSEPGSEPALSNGKSEGSDGGEEGPWRRAAPPSSLPDAAHVVDGDAEAEPAFICFDADGADGAAAPPTRDGRAVQARPTSSQDVTPTTTPLAADATLADVGLDASLLPGGRLGGRPVLGAPRPRASPRASPPSRRSPQVTSRFSKSDGAPGALRHLAMPDDAELAATAAEILKL